MGASVFVDTNVFVYSRDRSEPAKRQLAIAWLEALWRERRGRTSMQVLSEYYVTVTRKLKPRLDAADAWDDVTALFAWQPLAIDAPLARRGREIEARYGLSWCGSLVVGAAERQDCSLLLSEDLQDGGVYAGVTVRSPFKVAAGEAAATYSAERATSDRHPRRGRPSTRGAA